MEVAIRKMGNSQGVLIPSRSSRNSVSRAPPICRCVMA